VNIPLLKLKPVVTLKMHVQSLTEPANGVVLLICGRYLVIVLWSVDISGTRLVRNIVIFIR